MLLSEFSSPTVDLDPQLLCLYYKFFTVSSSYCHFHSLCCPISSWRTTDRWVYFANRQLLVVRTPDITEIKKCVVVPGSRLDLKLIFFQCPVAEITVVKVTFSTDAVLLFTGIHQPQQDQIPSIKESMGFPTTRSYGSEI